MYENMKTIESSREVYGNMKVKKDQVYYYFMQVINLSIRWQLYRNACASFVGQRYRTAVSKSLTQNAHGKHYIKV